MGALTFYSVPHWYENIKLSAMRWTSKGNLILTVHHTVTQLLNSASSIITFLIRKVYSNLNLEKLLTLNTFKVLQQ